MSASMTRPASIYTAAADRSPVVSRVTSPVVSRVTSPISSRVTSPISSRVTSPISSVRLNGLRSSIYEEVSRDVSSEEPPRQSSNKGSVRGKVPAMEDTRASKERPEDLNRRSSHERKKQLQRELEEIEAEEEASERRAAEEAASVQGRRSATPRKLTVRTEPREPRRSTEQQQVQRRSSERDWERERDSATTVSPLSPRSSGVSSKRSSLYGAHGDRLVPTLEESCKQLAKIRQDIVELREEIHQDQPGSTFASPLSATARMSTSKRPIGRERGESPRRNSLDGKYTRESSKPLHGRSDSFDSNEPSSPENRMSPPPRRRFFGDILGKLSRNVLHSSTMDADLGSSQRKASPTHRKGQAPHSMSHPLKPSRTMTDPEPTRRASTYISGRTSVHRQQSQPLSPMSQKYSSYEDRHHSGSSGQSDEFLEDLAYDQRHPYQAQVHRSHQQQHRHHQHQEQQQQQLASNQYAHHFRQAHDGSLILSERPLSADGSDGGCPAQIRPKELRFSNSVAGEVQSSVTLFNRSRRTMHFEILRPAGITVTPSYGVIQPGRDQRLTIHLAEKRGPGRVVVELDGEWLVPFGVSFV
ncbi:hypothetical protein EDD21DRAFT_388062, partial [Dissophora ornata]